MQCLRPPDQLKRDRQVLRAIRVAIMIVAICSSGGFVWLAQSTSDPMNGSQFAATGVVAYSSYGDLEVFATPTGLLFEHPLHGKQYVEHFLINEFGYIRDLQPIFKAPGKFLVLFTGESVYSIIDVAVFPHVADELEYRVVPCDVVVSSAHPMILNTDPDSGVDPKEVWLVLGNGTEQNAWLLDGDLVVRDFISLFGERGATVTSLTLLADTPGEYVALLTHSGGSQIYVKGNVNDPEMAHTLPLSSLLTGEAISLLPSSDNGFFVVTGNNGVWWSSENGDGIIHAVDPAWMDDREIDSVRPDALFDTFLIRCSNENSTTLIEFCSGSASVSMLPDFAGQADLAVPGESMTVVEDGMIYSLEANDWSPKNRELAILDDEYTGFEIDSDGSVVALQTRSSLALKKTGISGIETVNLGFGSDHMDLGAVSSIGETVMYSETRLQVWSDISGDETGLLLEKNVEVGTRIEDTTRFGDKLILLTGEMTVLVVDPESLDSETVLCERAIGISVDDDQLVVQTQCSFEIYNLDLEIVDTYKSFTQNTLSDVWVGKDRLFGLHDDDMFFVMKSNGYATLLFLSSPPHKVAVRDITRSPSGGMWIATSQGIFEYDETLQKFSWASINNQLPNIDLIQVDYSRNTGSARMLTKSLFVEIPILNVDDSGNHWKQRLVWLWGTSWVVLIVLEFAHSRRNLRNKRGSLFMLRYALPMHNADAEA